MIDVFSKYGWMLPIKDKTGKYIADAFKEIFKKSKRKPEKLWTDKGREFYNKHVKELGVEFYSTENRKMKEKMFKYFIANNTNKYIDVVEDFVERYNNMRHSSIKMTPVKASKKTNAMTVYRNLYPVLTRRPMDQNSRLVTKSEFNRRKDFLKRASLQTGQKKYSQFQKVKELIRLLIKSQTTTMKRFSVHSMSKSFRRHLKKFSELRRL